MEMKATHRYVVSDGREWLLMDCGKTYFYKQVKGIHADNRWSAHPSRGNVEETFGHGQHPWYRLERIKQFKGNK